MEALNFIRFWKPSNGGYRENRAQPCCGNKSNTTTEFPKASDHELDEGDDSFFDLNLPLHGVNGEKRFESTEEKTPLPPNDNLSKRKIIPIEASSNPQSPLALLKSAPKFPVFTLNKSRSMANTSRTIIAEKAELIGLPMESPKHENHGGKKHFRFQKYMNKFKLFYVKSSKKNSLSGQIKVSGDLLGPSPVSSPARGVCNQLGKSRSTSAASSFLISRRDVSLLQQNDGIQSAILHCKKSLNSSRESSRLSRCTSDSSQEKLSNASSTDSSLLSRVTSNSSYEKLMDSARISSDEGNFSST
ncbi:probable membrane-associated kinase regulator 5 [Hibiscus syriacus]|uniref:probable membrane-associated kinase regulator 5 n=1 Tax=Hibiscus syriacus TaxID=106335 RepID=UPI001920ABE5|nr:probable membrane-associated kinase regulator 5 [Hibiscus syriacus]